MLGIYPPTSAILRGNPSEQHLEHHYQSYMYQIDRLPLLAVPYIGLEQFRSDCPVMTSPAFQRQVTLQPHTARPADPDQGPYFPPIPKIGAITFPISTCFGSIKTIDCQAGVRPG